MKVVLLELIDAINMTEEKRKKTKRREENVIRSSPCAYYDLPLATEAKIKPTGVTHHEKCINLEIQHDYCSSKMLST